MDEDEDTLALRCHFNELFAEIERADGDLQELVLEHALLEDDPRYAAAAIHRWGTGADEERLIPDGWPLS